MYTNKAQRDVYTHVYICIHYTHIHIHTCNIHHVPKCMSCHKAIVVITARVHCFHDSTHI